MSSHLQDAVVRVGEMAYVPSQKRFAAILNRFNWEKAAKAAASGANERRRTALRFDRVLGAQIKSLKPSPPTGCCRCSPSASSRASTRAAM